MEMYFKLAAGNVRKSIRDYAIYFMTLTFGVCLFYIFNAIESQQAMMIVTETQHFMLQNLTDIMAYTSVFISVILACLIIYANRFLMKRRKKELGVYMLLGMDRENISLILISETLIIGFFALTVGLLLGILLSQGLSVVTAWMFSVPLRQFQFTFSSYAVFRAIVYFGIIFVLVMMFNVLSISRCRLVDLLTAHMRSETLYVKRLGVSVVLFVLSVASLAVAYTLILKNGLLNINFDFGMSIALGIAGTFLFFMSLSGFMLKIFSAIRPVYYRGLVMVVLRQINSKITTAFLSMTVICLMLFLTIGVLASSMGLNVAFKETSDKLAPFDVTMRVFNIPEMDGSISEVIMGLPGMDEHVRGISEIGLYDLNIEMNELMLGGVSDEFSEAVSIMEDEPVYAVSLSQYNEVRALQGLEAVSLNRDQFAVSSNVDDMYAIFERFKNSGLLLRGRFGMYPDILSNSYYIYPSPSDACTVILNDGEFSGLKPISMYINICYRNGAELDEIFVENAIAEYFSTLNGGKHGYYYNTKENVMSQQVGMSVIVTYLGMYVGAVFLITSAAVLAIQQLSEIADNAGRYGILRRIGTDEGMINKAVFAQIAIYFTVPLSLAVVHSIFGIRVANRVITIFGKLNVLPGIILSATAIVLVYGGYMLATYYGSKSVLSDRRDLN